MALDEFVRQHIHEMLEGPKRTQFIREFHKDYSVDGGLKQRKKQFLRPQIQCYAYPQYFSTLPTSQPTTEEVTCVIINSGGVPSTNTLIELIDTEFPNTPLLSQRVTLQPGQSKMLEHSFDATPGSRTDRFQLSAYDPLHDPLTRQNIIDGQTKNCLQNAREPLSFAPESYIYVLMGWREWYRRTDNTWAPQPSYKTTWFPKKTVPNPALVSLGSSAYFSTTEQTANNGSQLRQHVSLANLSLSEHMKNLLQSGELRAVFDGLVYLDSTTHQTKARIEIDFVSANGTLLMTYKTESPTALNTWQRQTGSTSVPSNTSQMIFKLIAQRPSKDHQIYFDELHLYLTCRNIFSSSRIYSF